MVEVDSSRHGPVAATTLEETLATIDRQPQTSLIALVAGTGLAARMPERPLTIATYAAGASLAAITLVYVFGPTFFLDDEAANSSRSTRKKGVVGLVNPANDCFINSVLQALAGLPELRIYLIREMHRRRLDGPDIYKDLTAALEEQEKHKERKQLPEWKLLGLQQGLITAGLKDVLDALNERPIYKKTISAQTFIRVVEQVFRTRISRTQQDAQEFLQIVAERLADEYAAGRRVRQRAKQLHANGNGTISVQNDQSKRDSASPQSAGIEHASEHTGDVKLPSVADVEEALASTPAVNGTAEFAAVEKEVNEDEDEQFGFPFEGRLESIVECSHCHFKPRPHSSSFVTLTLHLPQSNSTLNGCFDGMLKVEQIEGYTCDRCRLDHALQLNTKQLSKTSLFADERASLEKDKTLLESALQSDPENPPKDLRLPDLSTAPKRRISRHMRISRFPRILSLHLSRSVWDSSSSSSKNSAKVSFPETLPLGGLLDRKTYRLLGVVTHKGAHNSGHYESFRRQVLSPPYSTRASMGTEGVYSLRNSPMPSPRVSAAPSPRLEGRNNRGSSTSGTSELLTPPTPSSLDYSPSQSSSSASFRSNSNLDRRKQAQPPTSVPLDAIPTPGLPTPPLQQQPQASPGKEAAEPRPKSQSSFSGAINRVKMGSRKKGPDRWWRISDDKIKESKTSDVLGMQREVYLLFYEIVEEGV